MSRANTRGFIVLDKDFNVIQFLSAKELCAELEITNRAALITWLNNQEGDFRGNCFVIECE